jgi:Mg-chelatase subunit ChlD
MKIISQLKAKRGSVLVFSLIILFMGVAIALGMAFTSTVARKMSGTTEKTTQTFQVADSGAEIMLYNIMKISGLTDINSLAGSIGKTCANADNSISSEIGGTGSGKVYKVTFFDNTSPTPVQLSCSDAISKIATITSVGTYAQTVRAVNVPVVKRDKIKPNSDIIVLMDYSESMGSGPTSDYSKEQSSVINLFNNLSGSYEIGAILFNNSNVTPFPALTDISNIATIINYINTHNTPSDKTNLADAIQAATDQLTSSPRHGSNSQAIILITDGVPNVSGATRDYTAQCNSPAVSDDDYWSPSEASRTLEKSANAKSENITIFTIGIGFQDLVSNKCKDNANNLMTDIATSRLDYYLINNFSDLDSVLNKL